MYQETVNQLIEIHKHLVQIKELGLASQFEIGDFHLKCLLGMTSGQAMLFSEFLELKISLITGRNDLRENERKQTKKPYLKNDSIVKDIIVLLTRLKSKIVKCSLTEQNFFWDSELYWGIKRYHETLDIYQQRLEQWLQIGITPKSQLSLHQGLLRDCDIKELQISNMEQQLTPKPLTKDDLRDPLLKAAYLCSNAYLEVSAIEILSDLINQSDHFTKLPKWGRMGLIHQLIEECQHAQLLAQRVEQLGFELGVSTASTHTWNCYQRFSDYSEKIVAQQIVQEGVGLDSSAMNIKRFESLADKISHELYKKITSDEFNHVKLGVSLVKFLRPDDYDDVFHQTNRSVRLNDPLPDVTEFVELKKKAGYEESWLKC